jgi:hypothetical protein
MVTMGIFPSNEKYPWQNQESNPQPNDQWSENLTTRPSGWSVFRKVPTQNMINTVLNYKKAKIFSDHEFWKKFSLIWVNMVIGIHSFQYHIFLQSDSNQTNQTFTPLPYT